MKKLLAANCLFLLVLFSIPFAAKTEAAELNLLPPAPPCGSLTGTVIDPMQSVGDWRVVKGNGAISGTLTAVPGYNGQAVQLAYNLGKNRGAWVQLRRDFNPPLNLSAGDHLRFLHRGTTRNTIEVGLVSTEANNPNYFGTSWNEGTHVNWWTYATWDFKDFRQKSKPFPDFTQVRAIYISVVNTANGVGGTGSFVVDELQFVNLASRSVPIGFESITANPSAVQKAAAWIGSQQQPLGLLKSWFEEPYDYAWLYDQALGLIVLSKTDLPRARSLVYRLSALQNSDGSWYAGYHYLQAKRQINDLKDIGPIAWLIYALMRYYSLETDQTAANTAYQDAREAVAWLAARQTANGSLSTITEWNLNAWWAFRVMGFQTQADKLRDYLLNLVWDDQMGRFKSSASTYQIFLDNQTWGVPILRTLGQCATARRALSYARSTLVTTSSNGSICGLDGAGPFSAWNEGSAQYIVAGGENSQSYWNHLVSQQAADGGMPGSPDDFRGYTVWLTRWHGIAPTAWLYFAGTGGPYTTNLKSPLDAVLWRYHYTTATPTLTWNPITWASGYEIQVDSSPNFTNPIEYYPTALPVGQLSITTSPLLNGLHYWRVRAKKSSGTWGAWSNVDSFLVDAPSTCPMNG